MQERARTGSAPPRWQTCAKCCDFIRRGGSGSRRGALGVREAIEARGATLRYLRKYSPDLDPIEMPFSKLKAGLRKAAERTISRLRRRIGRFAGTLTARDASNYFRARRLCVKSTGICSSSPLKNLAMAMAS